MVEVKAILKEVAERVFVLQMWLVYVTHCYEAIRFVRKVYFDQDKDLVNQMQHPIMNLQIPFLSSPIACVACERTELLGTEIGVIETVVIFP